jgi:hypothetical protein
MRVCGGQPRKNPGAPISAAIVVILSFLDLGILEGWFKPICNLIILLMIVSAIVSA